MCVYKTVSNKENLEFQNEKFYYTDITSILTASKITIAQYNWLIVDFECNYYPNEWETNRHEYIWLSGNELSEILNSHRQLQFIWGIIVAYEQDKEFNEIRKVDLPLIDINKFEIENIKMQSELGVFEVVSIDSTAFSVTSKIKIYIENLKENIIGLNN